MAGAEIIASAIGILCLIIFGYVLVGGILNTGETAASAQNDFILMKEIQLRTAINIPHSSPQPIFNCEPDGSEQKCNLTFHITNTGSESIGDFSHMDIFVNSTNGNPNVGDAPYVPKHYSFNSGLGSHQSSTWNFTDINPKIIHPNMLDPNETMSVQISDFNFAIGGIPSHFSITATTPNGIIDTYYQ